MPPADDVGVSYWRITLLCLAGIYFISIATALFNYSSSLLLKVNMYIEDCDFCFIPSLGARGGTGFNVLKLSFVLICLFGFYFLE